MGKAAGYIIAAAQIVAGTILSTVGGNPELGIPLIISGVTQTGAMLLSPRIPSGTGGLDRSSTYGFDGATNAAFEGSPIMCVFGEEQIAPAYVSFRTEQSGTKEYGYALLHAGSGGPYGIESLTDFEINDQSIDNYEDVSVEYVKGTSDQSAIKGFAKASTPWQDGTLLATGTDWIWTTHRPVSEVQLVIGFMGGLYALSTGGSLVQSSQRFDVYSRVQGETEWTRETPPTGVDDGWRKSTVTNGAWAIDGKTNSALRVVLPLTWDDEEVREIKVRVGIASSSSNLRDATIIRVEEITEDDNAHAGDVLIGIKFLAQEQLSGGLPRVTCICRGWKFVLPGDSGWDTGSATPTWTRNPARIVMEFLLNDTDLCGDWIGSSPIYDDVDYDGSWATVADRCDGTVTMEKSGSGTLPPEPRWQLDYVVDTRASASEHLAAMLATFRAQIVEYEGKLHLVQDVAGSSVASFDSRISGDSSRRPILSVSQGDDALPGIPDITEQEIPAEERPTHVHLQYRDREDRYTPTWIDELVASTWSSGDPVVRHEALLLGVTRESQAIREARAILLRAELRTTIVEFGVGIGDLDLLPMDVVTLYADYPTWDGKLWQVLSTGYGTDGRGKVRALEYSASAYSDTSDKLPSRPAWLSRQAALKRARQIPRGASNVKITEVKGSYHLSVSWSAEPDLALRLWRVYLSESESDKGNLIAEAQPTERSYLIRDVTELEYHVRILAVSMAGTEEGWQKSQGNARYISTRTKTTPSALVSAGAAKTDTSGQTVTVVVDPPAATDPPAKVEVIKGSDAETGQLVGTVEVERSGITGEQGERTYSLPAGVVSPGRRTGGGTETLSLRAVDREGKRAGAATTVTVPHLDLANHHAVEIASIVGNTLSGISSPGSTDAWEVDATDGARLRQIPAGDDMTGWGTGAAGILADCKFGQFYLPEAIITFDEYDLGATYAFGLECYDEARRKSAVAAWASRAGYLFRWPAFPAQDRELRDRDLGPEWAMRMTTGEGKPLRPLPSTVWEWRAGTSTPLSGTWLPYVPGLQVYARYVQVRMTLRDPMGQHQTISPRVYVRAWIANNTRFVAKNGADFDPGELVDFKLPAGAKEIGVRTDAGNESIQINIGGTIFVVAVA